MRDISFSAARPLSYVILSDVFRILPSFRLKMVIVGYHIFINLHVNHIKNDFTEYRGFSSIFALGRTSILSTIFFHAIKNILNFLFINIIERGLFPEKKECEKNPKKQKQKYYQTKKEKIEKRSYRNYRKSIIETFLKMKKLKKEIVLTLEIKVTNIRKKIC